MAEKNTKHAFGAKENIEAAKTAGTIDAYDVLHLSNGEMGWIAADGSTVINTPRTQTDIVVNGVTGLGIADGKTISAGKSIDEIVKMLVQKAIPATYTKPTISIANNGGTASGSYEAGTTITPKLKATFVKNDSQGLTDIKILKGTEELATDNTSPLEYTGDEFVLGDESVIFKATASYQAAVTKQNNLGEDSKENWFDEGSSNSGNYTFTGQRQLFYGTGVGELPEVNSDFIRGLANKKMNPSANTAFTINVAVGQQYVVFAYPATLRDVNNVTYVEANDGSMAGNFTKETVKVADARGGENGLMEYKLYTYEMAVPAAATMTFSVKI